MVNDLVVEEENGIVTKVEDGKVKISLNINDKNLTVTKPKEDETVSPKLDLSDAIKEKIEKLENVLIKAGTGITLDTVKKDGTTTYTINTDLSSIEGKIATNTKNIEELEKKISNTSSNEKIKEIENKSYSGISNAIAMANLPFSTKAKFSIAAGYGTYMGNHSLAVGSKQILFLDFVSKCLNKNQPISHIVAMIYRKFNKTLSRQTIYDRVEKGVIKYNKKTIIL